MRGEALVAMIPNLRDWEIVKQDSWYRIPVQSAPRRWPPEIIAFYQPKVFGKDAFMVRYVARVESIHVVKRTQLFPDEPKNLKSDREYYQLFLEDLEELAEPIISLRQRRIVFIPTTRYKLETAIEINDLYDESPLEGLLWERMKSLNIPAERQFYVEHEGRGYYLDFALFCRNGNLDIETDGDRWHGRREQIPEDNCRNNALAALGWKVLRFNGMQVRDQLEDYCVPEIANTINALGGLTDAPEPPPDFKRTKSGIERQLRLFDKLRPYNGSPASD